MAASVTYPLTVQKISLFSRSSSTLFISCLFDKSHHNKCEVLSILVLISLPQLLLSTFSCRSLVCLLFQNVYSGPLPTLNFFFSIEFYELLVTLDVNSLLDVRSANIFSHLVGCLLILLMVYIALSFLCWLLLCCLCFEAKGQQGSYPPNVFF